MSDAPGSIVSDVEPTKKKQGEWHGPPRFVLPLNASSKDCQAALKLIFKDGESYPERVAPHSVFHGITGPTYGTISVTSDDGKFRVGIGTDFPARPQYWVTSDRGHRERDFDREDADYKKGISAANGMRDERVKLLSEVLPEGSYSEERHHFNVDYETLVRGINRLAEEHGIPLAQMHGESTQFYWAGSEEQRRALDNGTLPPLN